MRSKSRFLKYFSASASLILLLPFSLTAQYLGIFNLKDCLNYALENSVQHQKELLSAEALDYKIKAQRSQFYPQVNAYARYFQYLALPTYIFPEEEGGILSAGESTGPYPVKLGQEQNLFAGVHFDQVLFDQKFFLAKDLNRNYSDLNQLKIEKSEDELIFEISALFYSILTRVKQKEMLEFNIAQLRDLGKIMAVQFQNDVIKEIELNRIQVKIVNLNTRKRQIELGITQQKNYLKLIIGMPQDQGLDLAGAPIIVNQELRDELTGYDNFTTTRLIQKQRELKILERRNLQAEYYPRLSAFADFQFQAQRDRFNFLDVGEVWYPLHLFGVGVQVPVFHGFEKKAKLKQTEVEIAELELNLKQSRDQISFEFENARQELANSITKISEQEQNKELAELIFEQSQLQYKEGVLPLSELLSTEATLREANTMYQTALLDYKVAELKYLKAQGMLRSLLD